MGSILVERRKLNGRFKAKSTNFSTDTSSCLHLKNTPTRIKSQLESNGYITILPMKNRPLVDVCLHWPPIFDPDGYYYHRHDFLNLRMFIGVPVSI